MCASFKMTDDFKLPALTTTRLTYVLSAGIRKPKTTNYSVSPDVFSEIRLDVKKIMFVFTGADEESILHFPNNESNYSATQVIANETDKNIEEHNNLTFCF